MTTPFSHALPLRAWATPLVIGGFAVMGLSGALMFFHLKPGLLGPLHEWAGWLFLLGGGAHLWMNRRAFLSYLKRPVARGIIGAALVTLILSLMPFGGGAGGSGIGAVLAGLSQASVNQLAAIGGKDVDGLVAELRSAGIEVLTADETVAALAGDDGGRRMQIIEAALAP